jgi:hypothetical protein
MVLKEISREQVKKDVLEFLTLKSGDINLNETDNAMRYGVDDYDLIDMELILERKYFGKNSPSDGADLNAEDTLLEVSEKMFNYLMRVKK